MKSKLGPDGEEYLKLARAEHRKQVHRACSRRADATRRWLYRMAQFAYTLGYIDYPLARNYDERLPEERRRRMGSMSWRRKLKTRCLNNIRTGKYQIPPRWQLEAFARGEYGWPRRKIMGADGKYVWAKPVPLTKAPSKVHSENRKRINGHLCLGGPNGSVRNA